jgi:hypothetical protein
VGWEDIPLLQLLRQRHHCGGCATIDIPESYINARYYEVYVNQLSSELRQIPDNQEVFVDSISDTSIIIEIVEPPADENERSNHVEYPFCKLSLIFLIDTTCKTCSLKIMGKVHHHQPAT